MTPANSLTAISDENGDVRLLDTSPAVTMGFMTEHIRMTCHDNAIFEIDWSVDDMRLVHRLSCKGIIIGNGIWRSNWQSV